MGALSQMGQGLGRRLASWLADERGQMLAWTLIVTVAGGLIIGGFLIYATTSLITTTGGSERVRAYYTADAGAERCLVSLTVGDSNCNFSLTLNGYVASVTITGPLTNVVPSTSRYIATGLEGRVITYDSRYVMHFSSRSTTPTSFIQVNWAFTPTAVPWELCLYNGWVADTGQLCSATAVTYTTGTDSPAQLRAPITPTTVLTDGPHTILFRNNTSPTETVAIPFSASGGVSNTWVWANAYQDYIITSTVGGTVLEVIARQIPGRSDQAENPITVTIASWQFR